MAPALREPAIWQPTGLILEKAVVSDEMAVAGIITANPSKFLSVLYDPMRDKYFLLPFGCRNLREEEG